MQICIFRLLTVKPSEQSYLFTGLIGANMLVFNKESQVCLCGVSDNTSLHLQHEILVFLLL